MRFNKHIDEIKRKASTRLDQKYWEKLQILQNKGLRHALRVPFYTSGTSSNVGITSGIGNNANASIERICCAKFESSLYNVFKPKRRTAR
ncbi:unnamed protein product [Didymodactylos carnosus]|uniref:Uncharacterized protein n=1 Tax=Didymodactylos carnosus TaxID=1234261 RepID=A0A8S2DEQ8_9BILA|nr:unnamed protein product [Didymodactylos carnosus]CAF3668537.1 unnamed protein product [Didymodactylos carnosus]